MVKAKQDSSRIIQHTVCVSDVPNFNAHIIRKVLAHQTFTRHPAAGPAEEDMSRKKTLNFINVQPVNGDLKQLSFRKVINTHPIMAKHL
jgi:hypothetical protein